MKLIQLTDANRIINLVSAFFTFKVPTNIPVLMHSILIDDELVGYVATEDYNTVAVPHLYVGDSFKTQEYLVRIEWLHRNVYCPLMKALGVEHLVTNCDQSDAGTIAFMKCCGFKLKEIVIAEITL